MSAEKLDHTVLRTSTGQFMPGTAKPRTSTGAGVKVFRSVAHLIRKRWREETPENPGKLVEQLERLAFGAGDVEPRERLAAASMLVRLHDGEHAFKHQLVTTENNEDTGGAPSRLFMSCNEVDRIVAALGHALGVDASEVPKFLNAALAWQEEHEAGGPASDDEPG